MKPVVDWWLLLKKIFKNLGHFQLKKYLLVIRWPLGWRLPHFENRFLKTKSIVQLLSTSPHKNCQEKAAFLPISWDVFGPIESPGYQLTRLKSKGGCYMFEQRLAKRLTKLSAAVKMHESTWVKTPDAWNCFKRNATTSPRFFKGISAASNWPVTNFVNSWSWYFKESTSRASLRFLRLNVASFLFFGCKDWPKRVFW